MGRKGVIKQKEKKDLLVRQLAFSSLEKKVRKQTGELKVKKGQLKQGADREKIAEEQIYVRTKAMESALDGIFIIDAQKPDFPVIYANQSFQAMTGYRKREILGKNYFFGFPLPEGGFRWFSEGKCVS